jgi:V/A-type H+/Na+-transporting ATPase subunit D
MSFARFAPTKSALLQLRRQARFLELGHDMLERKRELLTRVVFERLADYRRLRLEARQRIDQAYRWLAVAQMRMGAQFLRQASIGLEPAVDVEVLPRSSVGVESPAITASALPLQPVGLMWTDASFDEARKHLVELVLILARLGEAETALWRLLLEQRKTQKRVNALKFNIIPALQRRIRFIQSALEEEERNTLFQMQVLRKSREGAHSEAP